MYLANTLSIEGTVLLLGEILSGWSLDGWKASEISMAL
jgi:hypothetical protein